MYKSAKYKGSEVLQRLNKDEKESFEVIEKLSKGFTKKDDSALALDEVLAAILEQKEQKSALPKRPRKTTSKQAAKASAKAFSEKFKAAMQTDRKPITIEDLAPDLQKMVKAKASNAVQKIQYELPKVKTPTIPKSKIPEFAKVVDDVMLGNPILLIGGAGTGKTTLAQNVAGALGRDYITINCSQWTAPTEIIGGQTLDGYQEGKMIEAWEKGMVLILDELPKLDPNTAGLLNDALAKTKQEKAIIFNSRKEQFKKHENFAVIATGNVYPNAEDSAYGANNKQDLSLLDRFSGSVYFIEKNIELEQEVVGIYWIWKLCNELRTVIETNQWEAQVSLRLMMNLRDTYLMEMVRFKDKKGGLDADEGRTLKDGIDSFISTFTEEQTKELKQAIDYTKEIRSHQYRKKRGGLEDHSRGAFWADT